jgi:hypothetical protein
MVRRIDVGGLIAAAGAILVVVSLFLDWFDPELTGWTAFEALDLALAGLALATLAPVAKQFGVGGPVSERHVPILGAVMTVVVAAALINHPPAAADHSLDVGIWLAFAGAVLVVFGGLLGVARIALAISISSREERKGDQLHVGPRGASSSRSDVAATGETDVITTEPPLPGGPTTGRPTQADD